jgi:hypothetical protein
MKRASFAALSLTIGAEPLAMSPQEFEASGAKVD